MIVSGHEKMLVSIASAFLEFFKFVISTIKVSVTPPICMIAGPLAIIPQEGLSGLHSASTPMYF